MQIKISHYILGSYAALSLATDYQLNWDLPAKVQQETFDLDENKSDCQIIDSFKEVMEKSSLHWYFKEHYTCICYFGSQFIQGEISNTVIRICALLCKLRY